MDALGLVTAPGRLQAEAAAADLEPGPATTTEKRTAGFAELTSAISESWSQVQMQRGMLDSAFANVAKATGFALSTVVKN